jgi:aryl-alcohol dehydrogenase-like predicted oxidoreductase
MRLWTVDGDDDTPDAAISAAVAAGLTIFDTARVYDGPGGVAGGNEHHVARLLSRAGAARTARIVTKGGMRREGSAWVADGRARTIISDCEESLRALDGIPIDLYLLHAPDPTRPLRTALRALRRLLDEGLVGRVGLANVNVDQLDEAIATVPVTAVEISVSPFDDRCLRDGTVAWCGDRGITAIAHSPLGGPRRYRALRRNQTLLHVGMRHAVTAEEVALAWVLDLGAHVVAIPGARRPATVRSAATAARLRLGAEDRETLRSAFGRPRAVHVARPNAPPHGDVVLVMGIPGAGKSRVADGFAQQGYARLNRDLRGGSLRQLCAALDGMLMRGTRKVVLDNTWLTRATRSYVIDVARRHGAGVRCIWVDVALADAQRNVVERILARRHTLPAPEEVRQFNGREGMVSPTAQMRALRELERPSPAEGFDEVEHRSFVRASSERDGLSAVFIAATALGQPNFEQALVTNGPREPHLVFDWRPDGGTGPLMRAVDRVRTLVPGSASGSLCPHPAGPPVCWCRPPLLGLILHFARREAVETARSVLIGATTTHRSMAETLACSYVAV